MGYLVLLSRISRTQVFRVTDFLRSKKETGKPCPSIGISLLPFVGTSANAWPAILRPVRAVSHSRWNRKLVVTSLLLFIRRTSNIQMTLAMELSARTIVRGILSRPHRLDNAFAFTLGIYLRNNRYAAGRRNWCLFDAVRNGGTSGGKIILAFVGICMSGVEFFNLYFMRVLMCRLFLK